MILGIGCDIVDSRRIEKIFIKFGDKFLKRILSEEEHQKFNNFRHAISQQVAFLAKRFAAKESVSKALGIGIGKLSFSDISVVNNSHGAPIVKLPKDFLFNGSTDFVIHVSISDEWPIAVAFAIISKYSHSV